MGKSEAKVSAQSGLYGTPTILEIISGRPLELPLEPTPEPHRETSPLNPTEFALKVKADWEAGLMPQARTLNAALKQACTQWERPDGRDYSAKSLAQLLYKKRRKDAGNPTL